MSTLYVNSRGDTAKPALPSSLPQAKAWQPALWLTLACGVLLNACVTAPVATSQSVAVETRSVEQWLAEAQRQQDSDHLPQAAHAWVQAALLTDDAQVVEDAAHACYQSMQWRATLEIAQHWLTLNATSQEAHELAALSAIKLFQVDTAVTHLHTLLDAAYITPAAGFMEWQGKLEAVDTQAATAVFKRLVELYPDIAEAHYQLARLAGQSEDLGLMQSEAKRAYELAPYWSPAGMLLARSLLVAGQTDAALATAKSVVVNDNSIATQSEYAELLLNAGRGQEAVDLWLELEQADSGDISPALRALAQLDYQLGNYQAAFTRFNRLLNTGKNLSESIFYLGGIAERTGAVDEARQLYARVQEGDFAAAAQLRTAKLIQDSEGLTAALTFLQSYGETDPEALLLSLKARAEMLQAADDQTGAVKLLQDAVTQYPDVASLRMALAFQQISMGKVSAALQTMREVLAERPQDATVLNALGYTLADNGRDYQAGYNYVNEALRYSPDSGAVLDSMGWVLYKLGRKQEALNYLQHAAQRMADSDLDLHLGEVLWSLGRKDDAVKTWQTAVQRFPNNTQLSERLQRAQAELK